MFLAAIPTFLGFSGDQWQLFAAVTAVILFVGTIIGLLLRYIFKIGSFIHRFNSVEENTKTIANELKVLRTELSARIDNLADISIQNGLSEAHSPRQLNDAGKKVLVNSGIDTVVDSKFDLIVKRVRKENPENAYQAEQAILTVVENLVADATIKDAVENGAFQSGHPIAAVLYVGGLYIRDRVLKELGFEVDDIDSHTPSARSKSKKKKK